MNISQLIKSGKYGGFQWSEFYSKKILKQINFSSGETINILSIYPFLPSYPWPRKWNVDFLYRLYDITNFQRICLIQYD